jgi:TATA-binding protein-associated factor Taf7
MCSIIQNRSKSSKFAPKTYEVVLLDYDSNSRAYRVFNVTTGCVETTCDAVFDETNDSQKEQVDVDLVDDKEATCDALQRMVIGDVRPQDPSNQHQKTFPNDTTPLAQGLDQDNHEEDVEPNDQGQEESNDQGGDEDGGDKGEAPPHPRVCQNIQRDHLIDNILGDIEKGVTTRSRVANFYEHYSFISSFKPFKVEDALRDLDWVVAM